MFRLAVVITFITLLIRSFRFGFSLEILAPLGFSALLCFLIYLMGVFGDHIGAYTGRVRGGYIDEPTPGVVLEFIFFLPLIIASVIFVLYRLN